MADKNTGIVQDVNVNAVDMPSYQNSGFGASTGANLLKPEIAKQPLDDATIRAQAETSYKDTYEIEQRGLQNQLSALIQAQTDDADLLNSQYQQSINTMMSKLAKRGLSIGATPVATTAALKRFQNEVMAQRQAAYGVQQKGVQAAVDTHKGNYELNVKARMFDIKNNSLKTLNELMTQMAQLQSASFEDYINYLLSKKKNHINSMSTAIQRQNLELDEQSIALAKDKIGLEGQSLDIARRNLGYESDALDIARDKIGLESQSLDLARKNLGYESDALDLARQKLGLETQSIGIDSKKLDIAAENIKLDKKFIKLNYENSKKKSKGGGGGGRRRGSGSSSSTTSSSSSSSNSLSSSYFGGSQKTTVGKNANLGKINNGSASKKNTGTTTKKNIVTTKK